MRALISNQSSGHFREHTPRRRTRVTRTAAAPRRRNAEASDTGVMTEGSAASGEDIFIPPVVVRPPTRGARPYRRVEIYGRTVGRAYKEADVVEFIRAAGVEDPDLDDPDLVGWRGGDRTVWSAAPVEG